MWVSVLVQSLLRGYENLNCLVFWLFSYKSCSVFFLPSKLVDVYEIWIIVWIWAFFFFSFCWPVQEVFIRRNWFGSPNQIFRFGLTKYIWICSKSPKSTWRVTFFLLFWGIVLSCFLTVQSESRNHDCCNLVFPIRTLLYSKKKKKEKKKKYIYIYIYVSKPSWILKIKNKK